MRALRIPAFILLITLASLIVTRGEDKPAENPVAAQFRKHLEDADRNHDGFVTREELTAEISKDPKWDAKSVEQIVAAMLRDLDADHDGKLSATEIAEGARRAGQNVATKQNVSRAQLVMEALDGYKEKHGGTQAPKLAELAKLHLVPEAALLCILADGHEKPWRYAADNQHVNGPNDVILFSPGRVDSEGQYIVGLGNGRVLGLHDSDLELEKVPKLKMHIYPDETPSTAK